jgi:hypothetical protein
VIGSARPSVDIETALDDDEWLELYHESLRTSAFWPRTAATALACTAAVGAAVRAAPLLGAPASGPIGDTATWRLGSVTVTLGMFVVYVAGYVWLAPRLCCRRLTDRARTARWRISAERLWADVAGSSVNLTWQDVDQVRVTRRLVAFQLADGRGLLALPRRSATELGETLILDWATHGDTPITHRS